MASAVGDSGPDPELAATAIAAAPMTETPATAPIHCHRLGRYFNLTAAPPRPSLSLSLSNKMLLNRGKSMANHSALSVS